MKATFIGVSYQREGTWNVKYLEYEYRGHSYFVRDAGWMPSAFDETLYLQHKREQERIDKIIEQQNISQTDIKYEDTVDYALDMLFDYWENGE